MWYVAIIVEDLGYGIWIHIEVEGRRSFRGHKVQHHDRGGV